MDRGLLLHVGLPKTGTTTLQRAVFSRHSQIYYLGKNRSQFPKGCHSRLVYEIMKNALWQLSDSLAVERIRNLYEMQLLPEIPADKVLVASWEGLGVAVPRVFAERLERLQSIFGRCRLMITLRNPLTWLPSVFLQNIKGHFIKRNRPWLGPDFYFEVEEFFEKQVERFQGVHNFLGFSKNIQSAISRLGGDNVGVFLFEELSEKPEHYYGKVGRFMGIDADETIKLGQRQHYNQRISQHQIDFLKAYNSSWWRRVWLRYKSPQERRRVWSQALPYKSKVRPAQVELPPFLKREIIAATQEGNRWLTENLDLPLAQYDYPL